MLRSPLGLVQSETCGLSWGNLTKSIHKNGKKTKTFRSLLPALGKMAFPKRALAKGHLLLGQRPQRLRETLPFVTSQERFLELKARANHTCERKKKQKDFSHFFWVVHHQAAGDTWSGGCPGRTQAVDRKRRASWCPTMALEASLRVGENDTLDDG